MQITAMLWPFLCKLDDYHNDFRLLNRWEKSELYIFFQNEF